MEQVASNQQDAPGIDYMTARAVAQFLTLAKVANVSFDLVEDRLVMRAARLNWKAWFPVRRCLDELGVGAIEAYFRSTTAEQRARLSAPAMH
jgi:hypothetical protein